MARCSRKVVRASLALALMMAMAVTATAQTRCFQPVGGVPGAYGQPPTWWMGGAPLGSMTNRWIDDPRWQGASSFSEVSDYARMRVLVQTDAGQRYLVMMFHVRADANGPGDRLYLGFWDDAAGNGNVFRIERSVNTSTGVDGQTFAGGAFNGRFYHRSGASPWALNNTGGLIVPPLPTWLKNDTRVDVFCGGTCDEWAVRMRIPIVPGADVSLDDPPGINLTAGGTYRFWYQIQDGSSLGTTLYGFPSGLSAAEETASATCSTIPPYCFPDPTSAWAPIQDGSSCVGDISLNASGIYIGSPGNHTVSLTASNAIHARPVNNTTSNQPGSAIKAATIRLANWGSVLFTSPTWETICTDVTGTAGSITPTSQFDINCNWTVPDPCPYKAVGDGCGTGTRNVDQCMLVDLASASGGGPYFFSPQSAWQNMMFNGASTFTRKASIDIRGLPPIAGGGANRDLYVYVKLRNMPEHAPSPAPPPVDIGKLEPRNRERLGNLQLPKEGAIDSKTAAQIQQAIADGRMTYDEAEAIMPTYIAYVWYDTGKKGPKPGGGSTTILAPQPAFGYFVWHDGGLNGWRQKFEGLNVTTISPNFYKVSVPENSAVTVVTTIGACEYPFCLELWQWLLIGLVVLILLVLLVWLFRKQPAGP